MPADLRDPHASHGSQWLRRAQPLLGTLVEVGVPAGAHEAVKAAFEVVQQVQRRMSVFEPDSDISQAHSTPAGQGVLVHPWTAEVLRIAQQLHDQTAGLFDVAQGTGQWSLQTRGDGVAMLIRHDARTRLDLGGIAKGWAVDRALQAALDYGATSAWVNAGGDVRIHGMSLPIALRDEGQGGVRPWLELTDGAMATSDFRPGARAVLAGSRQAGHVSVAAPLCVWADALTKVVALLGSSAHPMACELLRHYRAQAWIHDAPSISP